MKTFRIVLFLAGAALIVLPARTALADDAAAPASGSITTPSEPSGDKGARLEKFKAALAQLNLTDDQKARIKEIFNTVPKGKERRQQIAAVLTREQKEKLKQMMREQKIADHGGMTTTPAAK